VSDEWRVTRDSTGACGSNLPYHSILDREAKVLSAQRKRSNLSCRTQRSQRTPRQTSNLLNSETLRTLRPVACGIYAFAARYASLTLSPDSFFSVAASPRWGLCDTSSIDSISGLHPSQI